MLLDERMTAAIIEIQKTRQVTVQHIQDLTATSDTHFKTLLSEVEAAYRQLSKHIYENQKMATQQESKQQQENLLAIKSSIEEKLDAPDYETDHQTAARQRFAGSGDGVLQDKRFLEWSRGQDKEKHNILYLHGKPGAGKLPQHNQLVIIPSH